MHYKIVDNIEFYELFSIQFIFLVNGFNDYNNTYISQINLSAIYL